LRGHYRNLKKKVENKMRKKQIFVLLLITAFVSVSTIAFLAPVTAKSNNLPVPLDTQDVIDVSPEMMGRYEGAISTAAEEGSLVTPTSIGDPVEVGEIVWSVVSDWVYGYYWEEFRVIMEGEHGIILITEDAYQNYDAVTDEYVFTNPEWPTGGWNPEDRISTAQLAYMLDQFDTMIFPTVTEVFGLLDARGEEGTKVWALIHNIQDEAFYDGSETSYVAGYFSSAENGFHNRNMFHIDTHDWINRVGPNGARPYLYEGTFAHEFEHMCHYDVDPDEPSWVDEGLADLASFLSGYGHSSGHVAYYMVYHFWTPLTFWGGGLEDYGASYLFQLYLWEKYGGTEFISALVEEQANGIEGIENTLAAFGYTETFDEIFDDWTIANYIDDTSDNPLYGYDTLTIGSIDSWGYNIEWVLNDYWGIVPFGDKSDPLPVGFMSSWFLGAPMPYTAHYYRFAGQPSLQTLVEGDGYAGTAAYSGDLHWYSGMEAWAWKSFSQSFSIPLGDTELNFRTYFEIETDWDYGYVEVHDLNTNEWYTLEALGVTTSSLPNPQDNENCDDHREPEAYAAAGRWHAFTDFSAGYMSITMDLSPFAGHDIDLYFTVWQDGAYTEQMMYVDDIEITNDVFPLDNVEGGLDGWTTTGWVVTTGLVPNNWQATLIETLWVPHQRYPVKQNNGQSLLSETHMVMMDYGTEQVGEIIGIHATPLSSRRSQVLIVSNRVDGINAADYWVQFTNF
jgi:immune inhibitor A